MKGVDKALRELMLVGQAGEAIIVVIIIIAIIIIIVTTVIIIIIVVIVIKIVIVINFLYFNIFSFFISNFYVLY